VTASAFSKTNPQQRVFDPRGHFPIYDKVLDKKPTHFIGSSVGFSDDFKFAVLRGAVRTYAFDNEKDRLDGVVKVQWSTNNVTIYLLVPFLIQLTRFLLIYSG
jgi:hypothetical protein